MAINKPTKPTISVPDNFGGTKTAFSNDKVLNGFEENVPEVLAGDNLNYLIDQINQYNKYVNTIVDFINSTPINKCVFVNASNQLDYFNAENLSSHNIGEIVQSTIPLTDAGLHLLDGELILAGGSYNAFYLHMKALYDGGLYSNLFTTEVNWQASITSYGVCGKFVFTDGVSVRLPKITGFVEGTINPTNLGNLTTAGLPNHSHTYTMKSVTGGSSAGGDPQSTGLSTYQTGLASASNTIYGNSTTVQPQSLKVLYYICVATSVKTDIVVDIDNIMTDLNSKANKDLSNVSSTDIYANAYIAPKPTNTSGVGYTRMIQGTSGSNLSLPAGGTWVVLASYAVSETNAVVSNISADDLIGTGNRVLAGGTLIRSTRSGLVPQAIVMRIL